MRPVLRIALLGLVVAGLVGVPASAAPRWWNPPAPRIDVHASAGRAVQGGTLVVVAHVRVPRRLARQHPTPVARAVVHFASGDVEVDLTGRGRALRGHRFGHPAWWAPVRVWRGVVRVPVAANERPGPVAVDVTVQVGDGSVTVATWGRIRRDRTNPTPDPEPEDPPCTSGCEEL